MRRFIRSGRRRVTRRPKRRVVSRKRKTGLTVKSVRRIAHQALLKDVETKRSVVQNESWNLVPTTGTYLYNYNMVNIFSQLAVVGGQGALQYQFIGDEILNPFFVARIQATVDWGKYATAVTPASAPFGVILHSWIVAVNDQVAASAPTNMAGSTLNLNWFLQPRGFRAQFDGDAVRVVKHWSKVVNPKNYAVTASGSVVGGLETYRHKMVKRWKGKKQFEPITASGPNTTPSVFLKGWNYYFILGYGVPDGTFVVNNSTGLVTFYVDRYMYYKDP